MKTLKLVLSPLAALVVACGLFSSGCSTPPPASSVMSPIGPPGTSGHTGTGAGYLVVYSAYEVFLVGDPSYPHHTNYSIRDTNGHLVKKVTNWYTPFDSSPVSVQLESGHYMLHARASKLGAVDLPIVIEPGRTTPIFLDAVHHADLDGIPESRLVILRKGQKAGFRAAD